MPAPGTRTRVCAVCLFFAVTGPLAAEGVEPTPAVTTAAADELRVQVEEYAKLMEELLNQVAKVGKRKEKKAEPLLFT